MGAPFTFPEPATLDDVRRAMEALLSCAAGRSGPVEPERPDTPDVVCHDLDALLARHGDTPKDCSTAGQTSVEPDTAAEARARHLRRQLERAADHAAALLPALGLPRLVTADVELVDLGEAGDALALAIDTLDAPDKDREPWLNRPIGLAAYDPFVPLDLEEEPEHDEDDGTGEPTLGAPERHPEPPMFSHDFRCRRDESQASWAQGSRLDGEGEAEAGYDLACDEDELDGDGSVRGEAGEPSLGWPEDSEAAVAKVYDAGMNCEHDTADLEDTAPERAGKGFVRCGPDDAEDDDADEDSDPSGGEPGAEDDCPWRFVRPDAVQRAAEFWDVVRTSAA